MSTIRPSLNGHAHPAALLGAAHARTLARQLSGAPQ